MTVAVLAGGSDQIALINELKSRGHSVVLIDYFQDPPAKHFADKHIVASTLDIEAVRKIAREEQVDLVCTACTDQALLTVAKVSEDLGLSCYLSYQTGLNVTNKSYMKSVFSEYDIPTSRFVVLDRVDTEKIKAFDYPVVVKPVDCNSSKGVVRVDSAIHISSALEKAIHLSRTGRAIVEEFKTGREISADYYVEGDTAKLLCATESLKIKNRNSFTITCSCYPAISSEQVPAIEKIGNQIAKAFCLRDCPLFIQMIVDGTDYSVIEFSARMGGGSKCDLIRAITGVDIMKTYVDRILGMRPSVNPCNSKSFYKMVYLYCLPGVFERVEGLDELKCQGVIEDFFLYKTSGMVIEHSDTSSDRPAGYLVSAPTANELDGKLRYVDSHIKVMSKDGNDIMLHNLL